MTSIEALATTEGRSDHRDAPRWMWLVIFGGSLLAVLLLGAAAGIVLPRPGQAMTTAPTAGSVSVGFSQDMTVHHRQAVSMAGVASERSSDPTIRTLAYDIETSQLEQVGRMQGWLSLWDAPSTPTGAYMAWMEGDGAMSGMRHGSAMGDPGGGAATMPGMASPADLDALRRSRGAEFDVLFLQLILRHHQGGAPMLREGAERAEVAQVRNLAAQMLAAQSAESQYITALLERRGAQPLPKP